MELRIGKSCGSCIHTNRPKQPREHAAHYEVAKTERWCFKHNCRVTRETSCDDHEGVNRAAKTAFTRINNYNERLDIIREVVKLLGDKEVKTKDYHYTFLVEDNRLKYYWGKKQERYTPEKYCVSANQANMTKYLNEIKENLKK